MDIVGSTALKQGKVGPRSEAQRPEEDWFPPIVQFYREIARTLSLEWESYKTTSGKLPTGPSPEFWKGAGDEVIYTKELTDHREVVPCIQAWISAVSKYRANLRSKYPSLDLKSSAWLAGFPVSNSEVFFSSSVSGPEPGYDDQLYANLKASKLFYSGGKAAKDIVRDFIGPSIDTGFRVASLATPRKMTISVDLALLLAHTCMLHPLESEYFPLQFHYDGRIALKGVLGGAPYPIIWIDTLPNDRLHRNEDALTKNDPVAHSAVKNFCESFIHEYSSYLMVPYIAENADTLFGRVPPDHTARVKRLETYCEEVDKKLQNESNISQEPPTATAILGAPEARAVIARVVKELDPQSSRTKSREKPAKRKKK